MVEVVSSVHRTARVVLVSLYSDMYPAIDEAHSISVLAGCLEEAFGSLLEILEVVDMSALDENKTTMLLEIISRIQPNIIGISVPYGTYNYLKAVYPNLKKVLQVDDRLVIFGGATVTYIPEMTLREIDKSAIVVQGEGDEAIVKIVNNWLKQEPVYDIPNVCYLKDDTLKCQERRLVNVSKVPPPYRRHINALVAKGGQIFVENSRGCSWAACTFCLRGLTDVKGHGSEHRRFPFQRLAHDLITLRNNNVQVLTFSDEDFLGGSLSECEQFVADLETFTEQENLHLRFDVSMTVHSIFVSTWSETELDRHKAILMRLQNIGLRKVFLGIESGSPTQLKRYGKGQTPYESGMATQILRSLRVELEIGFIMFDPLCNLNEIEENITFLTNNKLAGVASALASELRVQIGERYLVLLKMVEQRRDIELFDRNLNPNTLSYISNYADPGVAVLLSAVRDWNKLLRPLHYPLKNLSRYGEGGFLQHQLIPIRECLLEIRLMYLNRLAEAARSVKLSGYVDQGVWDGFKYDLKSFSQSIICIFEKAPHSIVDHPIVSTLLNTANRELSSQERSTP